MATRRRRSTAKAKATATATAPTSPSIVKETKVESPTIVKETKVVSVKKSSIKTPKRVNKVTQPAVSKVTEVTSTPQIEKPEVNQESKSLPNFSQLTKLRGLDFVILPLIYLEAFVVNFLQNLDVKVPERVAIK